jgi:glucokinase
MHRVETLTDRTTDTADLVQQILRLAERVLDGEKPSCMGVAAPGPLDARTGVLFHPVNFCAEDMRLKDALEERFGVPAFVQNDANVAALGEWKHGGHGPTEHLIYVTVSTGVGSGIISHGRLIDGFNTTAGEIGHTIIDPDGPLCGWGHRGCVEMICSGTSIARAARERLEAGEESSLSGSGGPIRAETVAEAAKRGDALAADVFFHAADTLGMAVVNLIHLLSPEIVVIGGGVSQAGKLLFAPVRARIAHDGMPATAAGVQVRPAGLGGDAGLIGALALAGMQSDEEAYIGT